MGGGYSRKYVLVWNRHTPKVCYGYQQWNWLLHSVPARRCWPQHVSSPQPQPGGMYLSNSVPTLPLPPILELMWLGGAHTQPASSLWPHNGGRSPSQPLVTPTWWEGSMPIPHGPQDLGDAPLRQLMEDLWQEVAQRELKCVPQGPTLEPLEVPCRWWGPWCGRWGGLLPWGTACGPNELPPWPPLIEENVGHLLSTLATILRLGTPRINIFSGDAMSGKTEVSFEHWYHEVQCVMDHYPESVIWENIVRSSKGAGMAWPGTWVLPLVWPIFCKNWHHFDTKVSFDVLMQNFYKVIQGNHEKVPSFTTRLEGTFNQIRLQCPGGGWI